MTQEAQSPGRSLQPIADLAADDDSVRVRIAYLPALDGIRGLGLTFVLATHAGFSWAKGGFLWVSTFFTLSGYLITTLLLIEHERNGRIGLKGFWVRRFRRLLPGALLALSLAALFGFTIADGTQLERLRGDGLSALAYVANWRFVLTDTAYADLFLSPSPVQHFWTLSIEEQFYLFLPFVAIVAMRFSREHPMRIVGALVAMLLASVAWMRWLGDNGASLDRLYFGTDTRFPELLAGVILALLMHGRKPRRAIGRGGGWAWLNVASTACLCLMFFLTFNVYRTEHWLYRGGLAGYAVLSAVVVAGSTRDGSIVTRVLSFGPLPWIGRLSYGGYLYHWPLFLWLDDERTGLDQWPLFGLRMSVTLALAWVSLVSLERPIREGRRFVGSFLPLRLGAAVAVVASLLILVTVDPPAPAVRLTGDDQAMPELDPETIPATTSVTTSETTPASTPVEQGSTTTSVLPPRFSSAEPARIMVVGDSQAWVLGNAMVRWAEGRSDAVVWNKGTRGCGIVRGGQANRMGEITQGVCEDWAEEWNDALLNFEPQIVVVLAGSWDFVERKLPDWPDFKSFGDPMFDQHLVNEYRSALELLRADGAQVFWLTTPCYLLQGFGDDPRHLNNDLLPSVVDGFDGVEVVDLFAMVCPDGRFAEEVGGLSNARPDGLHLSDEAADWVAEQIGPELLEFEE